MNVTCFISPRRGAPSDGWYFAMTEGFEAIGGMGLTDAIEIAGPMLKGMFKAFINCSKVGRKACAYCKDGPSGEEEGIWAKFKLEEDHELGEMKVLIGAIGQVGWVGQINYGITKSYCPHLSHQLLIQWYMEVQKRM